jgi:hypothetical protein
MLPSTGLAFDVEDRWIAVELWTANSLGSQPESLLGHSSLRILTEKDPIGFTIQFVARLAPNEKVSYFKGITGSYPFEIRTTKATSYLFENIKLSRGLKRLKLKLNREEIHSLQIVYLWLIQNQSKLGSYFFFSSNCSQAILDYFSHSRIEISKAVLRGKIPILLADAFILSNRHLSSEQVIFEMKSYRKAALETLNQGQFLDNKNRAGFILWFAADRNFIRSQNLSLRVYKLLPKYNQETIMESLTSIIN